MFLIWLYSGIKAKQKKKKKKKEMKTTLEMGIRKHKYKILRREKKWA